MTRQLHFTDTDRQTPAGNIIYKILGVWCLHEPFCPAPTSVTADSDDTRNPQHFIYVTVMLKPEQITKRFNLINISITIIKS